jgi:hypothetical protein
MADGVASVALVLRLKRGLWWAMRAAYLAGNKAALTALAQELL